MRTVSPKKLVGGQGWGVLVGPGGTEGEEVEVVTRKGKKWTATLTREVQPGIWATSETTPTTGRTRERRERRLAKREEWADSRKRKAEKSFADADLSEAKTGIPLGQPILVGHHSERRHRKTLERAERKGFEGLEHSRKAEKHLQAAHTLARQLRTSIYDDDEDAVERLQEKLADLEGQRMRIKAINAHVRKYGTPSGFPGITEKEVLDVAQWGPMSGHDARKGYPPYVLQNLSGNIKRTKDRIKRLGGDVDVKPSPKSQAGQLLAYDTQDKPKHEKPEGSKGYSIKELKSALSPRPRGASITAYTVFDPDGNVAGTVQRVSDPLFPQGFYWQAFMKGNTSGTIKATSRSEAYQMGVERHKAIASQKKPGTTTRTFLRREIRLLGGEAPAGNVSTAELIRLRDELADTPAIGQIKVVAGKIPAKKPMQRKPANKPIVKNPPVERRGNGKYAVRYDGKLVGQFRTKKEADAYATSIATGKPVQAEWLPEKFEDMDFSGRGTWANNPDCKPPKKKAKSKPVASKSTRKVGDKSQAKAPRKPDTKERKLSQRELDNILGI